MLYTLCYIVRLFLLTGDDDCTEQIPRVAFASNSRSRNGNGCILVEPPRFLPRLNTIRAYYPREKAWKGVGAKTPQLAS